MKNRLVEHPNRYKLKPVAGENGVYDLEPMPGVVTEVGTPINKATLLSDETAALYGEMGEEKTVSKALGLVPNKINDAIYKYKNYCTVCLNAVDAQGVAFPGLDLTIIAPKAYTDVFGTTVCRTGMDGKAFVLLPKNMTFRVRREIVAGVAEAAEMDFDTGSDSITVKNIDLSSILVKMQSGTCSFFTSGEAYISPSIDNVSVSVCGGCGGGGGGGGGAWDSGRKPSGTIGTPGIGGDGGDGGGAVETVLSNFTIDRNRIAIIVGAGGIGGTGGTGGYLEQRVDGTNYQYDSTSGCNGTSGGDSIFNLTVTSVGGEYGHGGTNGIYSNVRSKSLSGGDGNGGTGGVGGMYGSKNSRPGESGRLGENGTNGYIKIKWGAQK